MEVLLRIMSGLGLLVVLLLLVEVLAVGVSLLILRIVEKLLGDVEGESVADGNGYGEESGEGS